MFISSLGWDGVAGFIIRRCSISRIITRAATANVGLSVSVSLRVIRVFGRVLGGW